MGSLFAFAMDQGKYAIGQVIRELPFLYVVIFPEVLLEQPENDRPQTSSRPLLAAFVSDAGFVNKTWTIFGKAPLPHDLVLPPYVVGTSMDGALVDVVRTFDGDLIRLASDEDHRILHKRTIANPAVVEGAARRYILNGPDDWDYERYLYLGEHFNASRNDA